MIFDCVSASGTISRNPQAFDCSVLFGPRLCDNTTSHPKGCYYPMISFLFGSVRFGSVRLKILNFFWKTLMFYQGFAHDSKIKKSCDTRKENRQSNKTAEICHKTYN